MNYDLIPAVVFGLIIIFIGTSVAYKEAKHDLEHENQFVKTFHYKKYTAFARYRPDTDDYFGRIKELPVHIQSDRLKDFKEGFIIAVDRYENQKQ